LVEKKSTKKLIFGLRWHGTLVKLLIIMPNNIIKNGYIDIIIWW